MKGMYVRGACKMCDDNQGCISIAQNDKLNERIKHVDVKFILAKLMVSGGTVELKYVPTNVIAANILTKLLAGNTRKANLLIL